MSSTGHIDDLNRLYVRFCEGDVGAQSELYAKTSTRLHRYILSNTSVSNEVIAELMQETWIKLWRACSTDYESVSFVARMYRIARSLTVDYWRAEKRTRKRTTYEEELSHRVLSGSDEAINKDSFSSSVDIQTSWEFRADGISDDAGLIYDLKKAIQSLPVLQRQAWILMQDGYTNEEISHMTNSDLEAVRSRIRYANSKLIKVLEDEG